MDDKMIDTVQFRISGTKLDDHAATLSIPPELRENANVRIYAISTQRGESRGTFDEAKQDEDLVVIKIDGGPVLYLHPETARTLLQSDGEVQRGVDDGAVAVSATLPWSRDNAATRGGLTATLGAVVQWFGIIHFDPLKMAARQSAMALAEMIDARVRPGLYPLQPESIPTTPAAAPAQPDAFRQYKGKPLLILIHGTFVDTASTFGKLWAEQRNVVKALFDRFPERVFAFDHPTVLASPIDNALALAEALPQNAVVNLLTHSRGGLVAEILVRAAAAQFDEAGLDYHFARSPSAAGQLKKLRDVLSTKKITVQQVVRVACPARGTLLASGRLDAYLSVFQWLLQLAALPVIPEIARFLREVARQGTQTQALPGIAAMQPGSDLIEWINSPIDNVGSSLYVLAGDSGGDSLISWIKTLVADAFYWTDNDLIVQTRSMYGGVPRAPGAVSRFMRFAGPKVSHFTYFERDDSAKALGDALGQAPKQPWLPIGPMSWGGEDPGGVRGAPPLPGEAGIALVIPDFFGSHLETPAGRRVWLSAHSPADFKALDLQTAPRLHATALVMECYGALCDRLAETCQVQPFPYDWRLSLKTGAQNLAKTITALLDQPRQMQGAIRIVAHGMGGLLLRVMHLNHREVWTRLMARNGTRILMLGVPQRGSWTPLQALSGDDTFANILGANGPLFGANTVRKVLAGMPGLIQMQAGLTDVTGNLADETSWKNLEAIQCDALAGRTGWHLGRESWAIPQQALLSEAATLWQALDMAMPDFSSYLQKFALVAGSAPQTPAGVRKVDNELFLECVPDGDGKVTLDSASIAGGALWRVDAEHGQIPRLRPGIGGLMELLAEGTTDKLQRRDTGSADDVEAKRRADAHAYASRPFRHSPSSEGQSELLALFNIRTDAGQQDAADARLAVRVYHGDLRFIRAPLIVGHYQSLSLTGSEAVVDTLVDGRMNKALQAGIYPDRVGSHQLFENGKRDSLGRRKQRLIPRPRAAVVVGLGEEGKLNAQTLSYTIRNGILAFAERLAEGSMPPPTFEIAATLVGSGGTGITVGNAALSLVNAVIEANQILAQTGWPRVNALEIVEIYLDRASDAWRVLTSYADANPHRLTLAKALYEGEGQLRRPLDPSYRGAAYDFISALHSDSAKRGGPTITYSLDTKRARTEVRGQRTQNTLLRDLVAQASNSGETDPLIRRTLFNLLVPVEIEPFLVGSSAMLIELDEHTSTLPWELLETDPPNGQRDPQTAQSPWAIRSKLIRKLQMEGTRSQVVDASVEDNVLIIGEPAVDPPYLELKAARIEALSIAKAARAYLHGRPDGTRDQVSLLAEHNKAYDIINQLYARNYRLIHIAGHGTPGPNGGVVLSGKNTFLGVNEIRAMRVTPELVFINCCYLGKANNDIIYDRASFAASVASALIDIGVRCVVAAGWAVEDGPAERFANDFYKALFAGARFIDAVGAGREAAWQANKNGNTWAAYQCYGDPDWRFRLADTVVTPLPEDEYALVASPTELILILQNITIEALYNTLQSVDQQLSRLRCLENKFSGWAKRGDVAEEFGNAYAALAEQSTAKDWFARAKSASDSSASLQAIEMYADQCSMPDALYLELKEAINVLETLIGTLGANLRRRSLLAIACKRLSVVVHKVGPGGPADASAWLTRAIKEFTDTMSLPKGNELPFYPARSLLECRLREEMLNATAALPREWKEDDFAHIGLMIDQVAREDPNFWTIVAQTQLDITKAVLRCELAQIMPAVVSALADLRKRIASRRFWIFIWDDTAFLLEPYKQLPFVDAQERKAAEFLMRRVHQYSKGKSHEPETETETATIAYT